MPSGIKISNRIGQVLYDSDWIAGVDYSEDGEDENEFEMNQEMRKMMIRNHQTS